MSMFIVLSPKVGSSFRKVPERSMTGISGSGGGGGGGAISPVERFVARTLLGLLFGESFTILGTILAELDLVALIKDPFRWLLRFTALLFVVVLFNCKGSTDRCLSTCSVFFAWLEYTGILVFILLLGVNWRDEGPCDEFTAVKIKGKSNIYKSRATVLVFMS